MRGRLFLPRAGVVGVVYPVGGGGSGKSPGAGAALAPGLSVPCAGFFLYSENFRLSTRSGAFVNLYNGAGDFLCKYTKLQSVDKTP